jgi:hypothetical protein
MISNEEKYFCLVESLQLLACKYDIQKKVLPDFVCLEDEIQSIFEKSYGYAKALGGKFDKNAFDLIEQIYIRFENIPDDDAFWEEGSLASHTEWIELRALASEAIKLLGEMIKPPKLNWRDYEKDVRRILDKKGKLDIIPDIIEGRWLTVSIIGDPDGLRYLATLLNWLADVDQEQVNMPDGEREHIHLHSETQLGRRSCEVELCRADAKGTGKLPDFMLD